MPIINVKGLPGLKGWGQLSAEEKQDWISKHPGSENATLRQVQNAYANSQFINEFGEDAFKNNSKAVRSQMMFEKVVGDKFTEIYGDEDDFDELNTLTTEGKAALLESGLANKAENQRNIETFTEAQKVTQYAPGGSPAAQMYFGNTQARKNDFISQLAADRNQIKTKIFAEDNERKQKTANGLTKNYLSALHNSYNRGDISADMIDEQFNKIVGEPQLDENGNSKDNGVEIPGIGKIDIQIPKSRYYDAFKDARWFNDFSLDEKMEVIATFTAMQQAYGLADAIDTTDRNMQKRVADRQHWTRQLGNTALNIGSGAVAYVMQSLMAFESLAKLGDAEAYANFIEGKDKNGNQLPDIWNMQYWDGVDQFGTFSPAQINAARERGGISRMQLISQPGKEYNAWATLNEGLKMMKFVVPDLILNGAVGKGLGAINKAAQASGRSIAPYINEAVMAFRSGLGISQAYSNQTYQQTRDEANTLIDRQVDKDASAYAERALQTDAAKNAIAEYARAKTQEILAANPNIKFDDINQDALLEEGKGLFETKAKQDYVLNKDLWTSDYNQDREEARRQAASAAITDFIIEQVRMFAAGMTWKNYTYDKATRQAKLDNAFSGKIVTNTEKNLAVQPTHWTRVKPMLEKVWGGFESNYFDDVTVAFGKGFGLGKFNNYLSNKYNPDQDAETIDALSQFFTGIDGAVRGAKESLTDFQSFYDGLVGALGTVAQATPKLAALKKDTYQNFRTDENGNRITIAEGINKVFMNPLLQAYSDVRAQERTMNKNLEAINKTIAEKKPLIEDTLSLVGSDMDVINLVENAASAREIKDAKVRQAYTTALWLKKAMNDPIMSQHDDVIKAQQTLERFAKNDITDADITEFLGRADNKSIADKPQAEAVQIARERMRDNAQQLIQLQRTYDNIMDDIQHSDFYNTVRTADATGRMTEDIVEQLAFMRIANQDWQTRFSDMEKEISGSTYANTTRNRTALYGSRKGWERAVELAEKEVAKYKEEYEAYKALYEVSEKTKDKQKEAFAPQTAAFKLQADAAKRYLDTATENLKQIKSEEVGVDEVLPILSKDEILNLRPEERAYMLKVKERKLQNLSEYSKEQQAQIIDAANDINMRDISLWDKIQDASELDNMIKDNRTSYGLILENPMAAADMVASIKANRKANVENRIILRNWDKYDAHLDGITNNEEFIQEAKKASEVYLNRYSVKHPEKNSILSGVIEVAKVKTDAAGVIDRLFESDEDRVNWKKAIDEALNDNSVKNEEDAMRHLEETVDTQPIEDNKVALERILEGLQDMQHQRNATVIQNREEARKEQQRKDEEKRVKSLGKTYGFDNYNVGDVIYDKKTGARYTVESFETGDERNKMLVRSTGNNRVYPHTLDSANNKFTKESPQKETPAQTRGIQTVGELESVSLEEGPAETQTPISSSPLGEETQAEQNDFTEDGAVKQGTEEEQQAIDAQQAQSNVVAPSTQDPYTPVETPYVQDTGTFPGQVLYEYNIPSLLDNVFKRVERRTTDPKLGNLLPQWFAWLDNNKIHLQEIIDYELSRILQDHPDTKIRFMKIRSEEGNELQNKVIVNVIEMTPELEGYHDNDKRGGIITQDGKNYLVVGTSGFSRNNSYQQNHFNALNSRLNGEANAFFSGNDSRYYISDTYSEVSDMLNGKVVNAIEGDTEIQYRTIGELLHDEKRNPRGYRSMEDLVFGVLYNGGLVTSKDMSDLKIYAPTPDKSRIGTTFVFVEAGKGAWVPLAIRTIDATQLREGRLKDILTENFNNLLSEDMQTRRDAAKKLFGKERGYLLGDEKNNILVGDEQHNNITIIKNGEKRTFDLNNINRADFLSFVSSVPFIVKTRMSTFTDIDRLEMYDEAGALMTNSALLGTVAQTYNLWDVNEEGQPVKKDELTYPQGNTDIKTPRTFFSTTLNGKIYREAQVGIELKFYDESGREIPQTPENQAFIDTIHWNIQIQQRGLAPIKDRSTGAYYVINNTTDNPVAVHRDANGNITKLDKKTSEAVIKRGEELRAQEERERATKAELARIKRLSQEMQQNPDKIITEDVPLGAETATTSVETKEAPKQQPVVTETKETSTREEKGQKYSFTNNGEKSLEELKKQMENTKESVTFETAWNVKFDVFVAELERIFGKEPADEAEAMEMFEKLNLPTSNINMDVIEDILKHCR